MSQFNWKIRKTNLVEVPNSLLGLSLDGITVCVINDQVRKMLEELRALFFQQVTVNIHRRQKMNYDETIQNYLLALS